MNVKNMLKKENIMPIAVLVAICLVVAILMGAVNMLTAPEIERSEKEAIQKSLGDVMPGGDFAETEIPEFAPDTVTAIYSDSVSGGHVVTLVTMGYGGEIAITVGVDAEGKITKATITKQSETHGQSGMATYTDNFTGLDAAGVNAVEKYSQATISSTTIKNAIYDAMIALGYATVEEEVLPKTDSEILSLAEAMAGKSLSPVALDEDAPEALKRLYKANGVYVAYLVVPGAYVPVATESMIAINANGEITDIELYQWVVGHGVSYTDEFLDSFIGKNQSNMDGVELVTEATGTSADLKGAVADTLEYIFQPFPIYRTLGIIVVVLAIGLSVGYVIYSKKRRTNG